VKAELGDIFTIDQNMSRVEFQEPEQGREQCTLSGSGTANDKHGGASWYVDVDVLENGFLGATGVGDLNVPEDDLSVGWPGAFGGVAGEIWGSVLWEILGVFLKTLDGAHLGLDGGDGLDQRVHDVGENNSAGQSGAVLGDAHDTCAFSKHGDGEDDQGREKLHAENEPNLSGVAQERGLVAVIDQVRSTSSEVVFALERGDGGDSVESLVDLGLKGRSHAGFEACQLTEGGTVEAEEEPVGDEHGGQNSKDNWGAAAHDSDGSDQGSETSDGLEDLWHEALVDGFHILGEAIEDTTGMVGVEPSHGRTNDTGESPVVECTRGGEGTKEYENAEDDHQERGGDADADVDAKPKFDRPTELVHGPPGEPLDHHNGTGLLGGGREDHSNDELPSTSSLDVGPPRRTADGTSGNLLIFNDTSCGTIPSAGGHPSSDDLLPNGVPAGFFGAPLRGVDHPAELAILVIELSV